jgi:ferric-dicitrate binding protein FerR (iron transport regulator)
MKDIIIRFFDKTITATEKKELHSWLKVSEKNRNEFLEMHNIWASSTLINNRFDAEMALEVFLENMKKHNNQQMKRNKLRRIIQLTSGVAAAITLLLYMNYFNRFSDPVEIGDYYTHVVKAQESKERVLLPDGSVVWIDKGAILSYSDQFNKKTRQVKIEGKAFFDVAKDKNKPFIVDLGEDKIKVFGTSFNVRNLIKESDVEVVLLTGSVGLELSGVQKKIMLKPNERIVYSKESKESNVEIVDANKFNIWTKDKLTFDNNTLSNVIPCLEIWYDVTIDCPEDLANNTRVSFTILNETKEQMLKMLALVAPVDYTVKDNSIFIYSKK